jgi:hypothetical protein
MNSFLYSYNLPDIPESGILPESLQQLPILQQPELLILQQEILSIKEYQRKLVSLERKLQSIKKIRQKQLSSICESQGGHFWKLTEDSALGLVYCRRCCLTRRLIESVTNTRLLNLHHFNFTSDKAYPFQVPNTPERN